MGVRRGHASDKISLLQLVLFSCQMNIMDIGLSQCWGKSGDSYFGILPDLNLGVSLSLSDHTLSWEYWSIERWRQYAWWSHCPFLFHRVVLLLDSQVSLTSIPIGQRCTTWPPCGLTPFLLDRVVLQLDRQAGLTPNPIWVLLQLDRQEVLTPIAIGQSCASNWPSSRLDPHSYWTDLYLYLTDKQV